MDNNCQHSELDAASFSDTNQIATLETLASWGETSPSPIIGEPKGTTAFDANGVNPEVQQVFQEPEVKTAPDAITPRQKFLHAILPELPTGSQFCATGIKEGQVKQTFLTSIQEIDELADKQVALGSDAYFAMASFDDTGKRLAKNATSYKCVWLDLDCGPKTDYPTHLEGLVALKKFVEATGLPRPTVVNSGYGLHAYWSFTESVDPITWLRLANGLKAKVLEHKFNIKDLSITSDGARILRLPDTLNFKNDTQVEVKLLHLGAPASIATYEGILKVNEMQTTLPKKGKNKLNDTTRALSNYRESLFSTVLANSLANTGCAHIADIYNNRAEMSEPRWRAALSIAQFCSDSESAIHDISNTHPEYDPAETIKKAELCGGPQSCEIFDDLQPGVCSGCQYKGLITTPIQLGVSLALPTTNVPSEEAPTTEATTKVISENDEESPLVTEAYKMECSYVQVNRDITYPMWIAQANSRFGVHKTKGGKMTITSLEYDSELKLFFIETTDFKNFKERHCSDFYTADIDKEGNPIYRLCAPAWLSSMLRSKEIDVIFDPSKPPAFMALQNHVVNRWMGLNYDSSLTGGDPGPMIKHILNVICNGDAKTGTYVLSWIAYLIQYPGKRHDVALVLRGLKGIGKGVLGNFLKSLLGSNGIRIGTSGLLTGKFGGHLKHICFLLADEADFTDAAVGRLNELITEPYTMNEGKFEQAAELKNRISILMLTNEKYVVPATADERRYCVIDVPATKKGDKAYWDSLAAWRKEAKNITAFVNFLKGIDLSSYNPRDFIETEALKDQRLGTLTKTPWQAWYYECLRRGYFGNDPQWPKYLTNDFMSSSFGCFLDGKGYDCKDVKNSLPIIGATLTKHKMLPAANRHTITPSDNVIHIIADGKWGRHAGPDIKRLIVGKSERIQARLMPSLEECREIFKTELKLADNVFD